MENQVYDRTDVFTFLGDIAKKLLKEGECLHALADSWFDKNTDENDCLALSSQNIARLGRQILVLRKQLCQTCATKDVAEVLSFTVSKITRSKLYSSKHRIAVDAQGQECSRAALTRDGVYILPNGGTALLYLDEGGEVVERSRLQAIDADGEMVRRGSLRNYSKNISIILAIFSTSCGFLSLTILVNLSMATSSFCQLMSESKKSLKGTLKLAEIFNNVFREGVLAPLSKAQQSWDAN